MMVVHQPAEGPRPERGWWSWRTRGHAADQAARSNGATAMRKQRQEANGNSKRLSGVHVRFWRLPLVAQQAPVKTGMKLGDFNLHDPFVLAHKPSQTYYLYNSAGGNLTGGKGAGVLAYKSKDLDTWDGPVPRVRRSPGDLGQSRRTAPGLPRSTSTRGSTTCSSPCTTGTSSFPQPPARAAPDLPEGERAAPPARDADLAWPILPTAPSKCTAPRCSRPRTS